MVMLALHPTGEMGLYFADILEYLFGLGKGDRGSREDEEQDKNGCFYHMGLFIQFTYSPGHPVINYGTA
jgi:hypothetical protein